MNYNDKALKVFLAYIHRQKKLFYIDMVCAVLVAVIDLLFPYISRHSMQTLLPNNMFKAFYAVMIVVTLAFLMKGLLSYIIIVIGHRMGVLVEADMRRDLFMHMQLLSFSFYDKNRTGALMSRVTSDLFDITELAHHGPENIIICGLTIVGALIVMIAMNPILGAALALVIPLCLWFTLSQRVKMKNANIEVKAKTAEINSAIESSISGIRTAKAFANESQEQQKFDVSNSVFKSAKVKYYQAMGLFMSGMEFTTSIAQVVVIALGGYLIMLGKMDYIDLITFTLYVSAFITPVRKLTQFSEQFMMGSAGFTRFLEIMRTQPTVLDDKKAEELENVSGVVDFENVGFAYSNGIPVLENINLHIEKGRCLAVVGSSGGGKTTLCQLLPRFYDVSAGSVKVDGKDVRKIKQSSLRKNIGMIQQDVFMFAGTVKDNILYGKPDATDEEIITAARRAQIHDEIMKMPKGYDTYIGERGVMLSGGQKQRISIARIFLKNPPILIMDEATSALDTVTEQKIQESLDELSVGRTSLIIAHRLSTVRNADAIAVVENHRIIEMGTHDELLQKNGEYARLYRAQALTDEVK